MVRRIGNAIIGREFTGDPRWHSALDIQVERANPEDVASGQYSVMVGNTRRGHAGRSWLAARD